MTLETDEQIISRKTRERAVRKAWSKFRPEISKRILARQARQAAKSPWRLMTIGEIIGYKDMRITLSGEWIPTPRRHIGSRVLRANMYRTTRPR